jgi:hypothetical protein
MASWLEYGVYNLFILYFSGIIVSSNYEKTTPIPKRMYALDRYFANE